MRKIILYSCIFILLFMPTVASFANQNQDIKMSANKRIEAIYKKVIAIKDKYPELKDFSENNLKNHNGGLYIVYGFPWKKTGQQFGIDKLIYIDISWTENVSDFKLCEINHSIFYILDNNLYIGYVVWARPELRHELLAIIEESAR